MNKEEEKKEGEEEGKGEEVSDIHPMDREMGWENPLNKDRRQKKAKRLDVSPRVPHPIILPPSDPIVQDAAKRFGERRKDKNYYLNRLSYNAQLTWWLMYLETLHRLEDLQKSDSETWTMRMVSEIIECTCIYLYGSRDWNPRFAYYGGIAVQCILEAYDAFQNELDMAAELPEDEQDPCDL